MSANSKIEWTDHTFNPWIGCTKVSPGCAHCYAEQRDRRHLIEKVDHWGKGAPRLRTSASNWRQPLKWNRAAAADLADAERENCAHLHRRPRVFCASLADIFDDEVPIEWLADLLALVHDCQNLDFQILTKRPENFRNRLKSALLALQQTDDDEPELEWLESWIFDNAPPPNVWIGTSVEDQTRADDRIPRLLQIPAHVRFLSCEPLLGPVDLYHVRERLGEQSFQITSAIDHSVNNQHGEIDWVIVGGESGPKARPCKVEWIADLVAQCQAASAPVFVKQLGAVPTTDNANMFDWPDDARLHEGKPGEGGFAFAYVGLDHSKGGDWNEWPEDLRVRQFPGLSARAGTATTAAL